MRVAHPDVVVVGAGVVGAACAEAMTANGLSVSVLDRGAPVTGTTASGEGNVLVSDKQPGPELALAALSVDRWPRLLDALREELGPAEAEAEWDAKGGLVVATTPAAAGPLIEFAGAQRAEGVDARPVGPAGAAELEPHLTDRVAAAVHYPQDAQLNPVLATLALLAAVRARGGSVRAGITATGVRRDGRGAVRAVSTTAGDIACGAVVNACGPWSAEFARAAGTPIAVRPRRGMVLVTGPLSTLIRHKVYDADYVGTVGGSDADLRTSSVVESTKAGTVLIGSSRERAGFDQRVRVPVLRELASKAVALFPVLGDVPVLRAYGGLRPYTPDHLPVIGPDPRLPGMWHATGHEGAGIGLAPATGELLARLFTGAPTPVDPRPFRVDRAAVSG